MMTILHEMVNESMTLYHGTSESAAENIRLIGFKSTNIGMSSESNENVIFLSTKSGAKWFAKNNTRISNPDIVQVRVMGKFLEIDKPTSDFGAFAIASEKLNVPFVGNPSDRVVDEIATGRALKQNGYIGIFFKDKNAKNIPVWAIIEKSKIVVI